MVRTEMWCWGGKREKGGGSLVEGGGVVLSGVGQKLNRPATPQVRTIGKTDLRITRTLLTLLYRAEYSHSC